MGANFDYTTIPGTKTKQEIPAEFSRIVEDCRYEYGHGGYTGTFAEVPGVRVCELPEGVTNPREWLDDNAEKWGDALAVLHGGKWHIGAICSC